MNAQSQRVCAWAGIASIVIWVSGFWVVAGFIPPPSPLDSPEQVQRFYIDHKFSIRLGMIMTMMGAALLLPWFAATTLQLRRIEGRFSPYTLTWFAAGAIMPLEFIFPVFFWMIAAYRPEDRDPKMIQMLNDMGWLPFVGLTGTVILNGIVLGLIVLRDRSATPVFPRWLGYFSLWMVLLFSPASFIVFFKGGPFDWGGLFSFWAIFVSFLTWMLVITVLLFKAIRVQERGAESTIATEPATAT